MADEARPFSAGPGVDPQVAEDPTAIQAHMGFRMTAWAQDRAVFEMPIEPVHLNRHGIPHGGVYAMLLDTAMGYAGCYTGSGEERRLAMTLSLTTSFIGRPAGRVLIAEAQRIGGGKRTFFAEGTVRDETDTLIATASGTFRYRAGS